MASDMDRAPASAPMPKSWKPRRHDPGRGKKIGIAIGMTASAAALAGVLSVVDVSQLLDPGRLEAAGSAIASWFPQAGASAPEPTGLHPKKGEGTFSSEPISSVPSNSTDTSSPAPEATVSTEPATVEQPQADRGDYILPDTDRRYYSPSELEGLSMYELYLARNEIHARRGYIFTNQDLVDYFNSKSWYQPRYYGDEFRAIPGIENEYEYANSEMILRYEMSIGSPYVP